jgi:hypothetical protein
MKRLSVCSAALALLLLAVGAAQATPLPVVSASLGGGQGCPTASCTSPTLSWNSSSGGGSGSVDLDTGALTLTFSITLSSSTFLPSSGPNDNGVTQLDFTNVTYSGTATVMGLGGGLYWITGGTASVAGTQTPSGAGSAGAFSASDSLLSGSCTDSAGSVSCGIIFSTENDFNFLVNGETRHFTHTLNVSAPEPLTGLLLGCGLAVVGLASRHRRSTGTQGLR